MGLKLPGGVLGTWKKTSALVSGVRLLNGFHDFLPVHQAYNFSAMNKMANRAIVPSERPTPRPTLNFLVCVTGVWVGVGWVEVVGSEGDDGEVSVLSLDCVVVVLAAAEEAVERSVAVWIRLLTEIIVIASPSGTEKVPWPLLQLHAPAV